MSAIWRTTLTYRNVALGVFSQNVLHFEDASETKTPDAIKTSVEQFWWGLSGSDRLVSMSSLNVQLINISLQRIDTNPAGGTIPFGTNNSAGSQGTGIVYPTVGLCFTLLDGGSGRKHRGRVYHSATPSNFLTNGVPSSVAVNAFASLRTKWLNSFGPLPTEGISWVIWHRAEQGNARWSKVTDIRLSPFARCQRRRNFGVGF